MRFKGNCKKKGHIYYYDGSMGQAEKNVFG